MNQAHYPTLLISDRTLLTQKHLPKAIALFLTCVLLGGCRQKPDDNIRASVSLSYDSPVEAANGLAKHKRVDDLKSLLALNGKDVLANSIISMGSVVDHSLTSSIIPKGHFIGDVGTIVNQDRNYLVAIAKRSQNASGNHQLKSDILSVFDSDGTFVRSIGGTFDSIGINGNRIQVTTMGIPGHWFAVVSRYDQEDGFKMVTEVIELSDEAPTLVRFRHRGNDLVITYAPSGDPEEINGIQIMPLPDEHKTGKNGRILNVEANGSILWNSDKHRFYGTRGSIKNGTPLYSVDIEQSTAFDVVE